MMTSVSLLVEGAKTLIFMLMIFFLRIQLAFPKHSLNIHGGTKKNQNAGIQFNAKIS